MGRVSCERAVLNVGAREAAPLPLRHGLARLLYRQMPMRMVVPIRLVGAPTVGPDPRRAEQLPARAQDDTEGLFVED